MHKLTLKVQFYKKTLPKKNEKNSKSSNTEVTYKEKRGDTDFITTKRQGYLYFHLKMVSTIWQKAECQVQIEQNLERFKTRPSA